MIFKNLTVRETGRLPKTINQSINQSITQSLFQAQCP